MKYFLICCMAPLFIVSASAAAREPAAESTKPFAPKFYAFQNGVAFGSHEQAAKTLGALGYDGVSQVFVGGEKLARQIAAYEKHGLKVLSIYLNVDDKPIAAEVVKPLAGRGGLIELTVRKMTPQTVAAVRQTAEMASKLKTKVALYPHHGFAVATMPEALELAEKVDHPNLGVMFNLCHFLRNEDPATLEQVLEKAGPKLFAVSISGADSVSGADKGGKGWGDLIKPLDQGTFPQDRVLRALKKLGFDGPVGLQCYGVRGDKRENLKRSIAAWKKLLARVNE